MMGQFREITPDLLAQLKNRPSLAESIMLADFGGDPGTSDVDTLLKAMPAKQREAMKAVLETMQPEQRARMEAHATTAAAALREVGEDARRRAGQQLPLEGLGERISLEKAWHGLHLLLCGSAEPAPAALGQAVLGGIEIGKDRGYGPARFLDPEAVRRATEALRGVSADDLRKRYDPVAMNRAQIYPGGWDDPESLEWLLEAFEELAAFYEGVAVRGNAVLLYLT